MFVGVRACVRAKMDYRIVTSCQLHMVIILEQKIKNENNNKIINDDNNNEEDRNKKLNKIMKEEEEEGGGKKRKKRRKKGQTIHITCVAIIITHDYPCVKSWISHYSLVGL